MYKCQDILKVKGKRGFMIAVDIIILGFIAGFILYKLYITIGKRDNDGEVLFKENQNNIIDISSMVKTVENETPEISQFELELSKKFGNVIYEIKKIDPNFSLEKFLDGSKKAFELVLNSFSANDRQTLETLLDNKVYNQFINEIDKRIQNKIILNLTLVSLSNVEVRDVRLLNNVISIDVFYQSQQITILKDSANNIVEGNPSEIDNVEDLWTYSKDLNSSNNWLLVNVNAAA